MKCDLGFSSRLQGDKEPRRTPHQLQSGRAQAAASNDAPTPRTRTVKVLPTSISRVGAAGR